MENLQSKFGYCIITETSYIALWKQGGITYRQTDGQQTDGWTNKWIDDLITFRLEGAAVAEWLSSWLAEQEDRGSIPGLATWIFRDWLSPASKSRYG